MASEHASAAAAAAATAIPPEEKYAVGILFVHGMGEQVQGDSVTEMGDALTEWLRKWLPDKAFKIREARLRSGGQVTGDNPDHPIGGQAHVSVAITDPSKKEPVKQEWLLAESWWASTFRQATFFELVAWTFSAGPWLIASQRARLVDRFSADPASKTRWRRILNGVGALFLTLVAAIVAAAIFPVFLALLLVTNLPIPGLSDLARPLVNNLSGSFGDLLILVRSPVRFAAMAEQVRGDIHDIAARCEKVIVLAHSQGSAVSWHAIRRSAEQRPEERATIDLFLSFGQAFRKLKSLYRVQTAPGRKKLTFIGLATLSTLLLIVMGYFGAGILGEIISTKFDLPQILTNSKDNIPWFAGALIAVLIVQEFLVRMASQNDLEAEGEVVEEVKKVRDAMPHFKWLDLWASADPAPVGPLLNHLPYGVESYKIRNFASTIFDHSMYWANRTVFVSAVAFAAASLAPPSPMGTRERIPQELRDAARVRGRRVGLLLGARILFIVAFATTLWGARKVLPAWGAATLQWIDSLPLPDWFGGWPGLVNGFVAAAVVGIATLVLWYLTAKGWDTVIAADEAAFFNRRPAEDSPLLLVAWVILAALIPTAAITALAIILGNTLILAGYLGISLVAVPVALISLSRGGVTLDKAPPE
jgi:hypothetical protein